MRELSADRLTEGVAAEHKLGRMAIAILEEWQCKLR